MLMCRKCCDGVCFGGRNMPKKRAAKGTKNTKANAKKTTEAVHETPREVLEDLLSDLDAQG